MSENLQEMRTLLFTPCSSKEHLMAWMKLFLGVQLPHKIVSEESNSCPMDFIWEVYHRLHTNDIEDFSNVMAYAARFSGKTLGASILEVLTVVQLNRDVIHMAAVLGQSEKAQEYVKKYLSKPYLRDFVDSDNNTESKITSYISPSGIILNEKELRNEPDRNSYVMRSSYIRIIPCTMTGTNSQHTNGLFCVDGDTQLLRKVDRENSKYKRDRVSATARGIYRLLRGDKNVGGRSGGEFEESITPKVDIEILGLNTNEMSVGFGKITHATRQFKDTVEIVTENGSLVCTPDHPVFTGTEFVEAGKLKEGDSVASLSRAKSFRSPIKFDQKELATQHTPEPFDHLRGGDRFEQVLMGSLLGDMGIYRKPGNNAYVAEQHCVEQGAYLQWKRSILHDRIRTRDRACKSGCTGEVQVGFSSGNSPLLNEYVALRANLVGIEKLEALGLAVWYMDDGCAGSGFRLSTEGFSEEQNTRISSFLSSKFGIETEVTSYSRGDKKYFHVRGGLAAKRRLSEIVAPFIHPDMAYKFDVSSNFRVCPICGFKYWFLENGPMSDCGKSQCRFWRLQKQNPSQSKFYLETIKKITPSGKRWVYDFTVEGNGNFWSNGILSKNCGDEIDVIPKDKLNAYAQAQSIPSSSGGIDPITLLTSTRKSRVGLVQQEIDKAEQTGLQLRHWNLIDVLEPCLPARHKPELPKETFYINDNLVKHISKSAYELLPNATKEMYYPKEGFAGCATCRLFPACKSRLATHQEGNPKDYIAMSSIRDVIAKFKKATPEYITTEFMARKPDASGLVYPRLDPDVHKKTAVEMGQMIVGEGEPNPVTDKSSLIELLKRKGAEFYGGMDYGFSHLFSASIFASYGQWSFFLESFAQAGLELSEQIENTKYFNVLYNQPTFWPDPAYPGHVLSFKKNGFRLKDWDKNAGSVKAGIEIVRYMLHSSGNDARLFFLKDDAGVEAAFEEMRLYRLKMDAAGRYTEEPVKENDDHCDSIRYAIMNKHGKNGSAKEANQSPLTVAGMQIANTPTKSIQSTQQQWMKEFVRSQLSEPEQKQETPATGKRGKFVWSF